MHFYDIKYAKFDTAFPLLTKLLLLLLSFFGSYGRLFLAHIAEDINNSPTFSGECYCVISFFRCVYIFVLFWLYFQQVIT